MSDALEFYEFEKAGVLINKRQRDRAFLLGLLPWTSLVKKLWALLGSGAETVLFEIGKSYGASLAAEEQKRAQLGDQELTISVLARNATIAGWGKVMVSSNSSMGFEVKIERCVFCAGLVDDDPKEKRVPCFFVKGVILGFAEVLFGRETSVEEAHCGNDHCQFSVIFR